MKRRLRDLESVRRFLAFVNGSVDDAVAAHREFVEASGSSHTNRRKARGRNESEVAKVHERATALANLLADVSAKKSEQPPPWHSEMKTASTNRLGEMRWYCERMMQALDLGEQLAEENSLLQRNPLDSTVPQPMREAVQLLIADTFYSHVLVMRCAWPECGNFMIEDRNVRDSRRHRRYCSTACRRAVDNDKRKRGGYWKEHKRCVRELSDGTMRDGVAKSS